MYSKVSEPRFRGLPRMMPRRGLSMSDLRKNEMDTTTGGLLGDEARAGSLLQRVAVHSVAEEKEAIRAGRDVAGSDRRPRAPDCSAVV